MSAKGKARTYGEDLMRGERDLGPKPKRRRPDATPGGQGGKDPKTNLHLAMSQSIAANRSHLPAGLTFGQIENFDQAGRAITGTSIFDPVLCECVYRWFCPPGGAVLDPFAGGSVRGIVAGMLGRAYTGVDLSGRQIDANRAQAEAICRPPAVMPRWFEGDAVMLERLGPVLTPPLYDLIFSCPPYADLEVYSEDPRDLSTMPYPRFRECYTAAIAKACALLKPDRFACFVVGDARGRDGFYYGLPWHTVAAFEAAGLRLYNDAVLVTAVGSLPVRTRRQFEAGRKLGKTHQNVLIFVKGDPKRATAAVGPVQFGLGEDDIVEDAGPVERVSGPVSPAPPPAPSPRRAPAVARPPVDFKPSTSPTAIERRGNVWLKRDDQFTIADVAGGKVRTCWHIATAGDVVGLVTAGSRASPQVNIVAHIARALGVPCRVHVPSGDLAPELLDAVACGAEIVPHRPGYNSVIVARARDDATQRGWTEIPFGMECDEAVRQTAGQVVDIPAGVKRIVVPVGSGMSLAGVLTGLRDPRAIPIPVLGVVVGADPVKRLDRYAPLAWRDMVKLVKSDLDYHTPAPVTTLEGVALDAIYEAKCLPFLEPDDLLWLVGIRRTAQ